MTAIEAVSTTWKIIRNVESDLAVHRRWKQRRRPVQPGKRSSVPWKIASHCVLPMSLVESPSSLTNA